MTDFKKNFAQTTPQPLIKTKKKLWWILGGILGLIGLMLYFHTPQASIQYGICKVYIELNEPYPKEIKYTSLFEYNNEVTIYYRKIDPFGVVSINNAKCVFKKDNDSLTPYLESFDLNQKYRKYQSESPEKIKLFNASVPAILANPPDLTIPSFPWDDISQYHGFFGAN